jgi:hypothetical protein
MSQSATSCNNEGLNKIAPEAFNRDKTLAYFDIVRYSNQFEYCTIISSYETAITNSAVILCKRDCNITHLSRDIRSPNPLGILAADKLEPLFRVQVPTNRKGNPTPTHILWHVSSSSSGKSCELVLDFEVLLEQTEAVSWWVEVINTSVVTGWSQVSE